MKPHEGEGALVQEGEEGAAGCKLRHDRQVGRHGAGAHELDDVRVLRTRSHVKPSARGVA